MITIHVDTLGGETYVKEVVEVQYTHPRRKFLGFTHGLEIQKVKILTGGAGCRMRRDVYDVLYLDLFWMRFMMNNDQLLEKKLIR